MSLMHVNRLPSILATLRALRAVLHAAVADFVTGP